MAPLAEWHAGRQQNGGSSSQSEDDEDTEDEEERWPGAVSQDIPGRGDNYKTFYDKKPSQKESTSTSNTSSRLHRSHSESKRKISPENGSSRHNKTERSNSD